MGMTKITIRTGRGYMEIEADEFEPGFAVHPRASELEGEPVLNDLWFCVTDIASGCMLVGPRESATEAITAFNELRSGLGELWEGALSAGREKVRMADESRKQGGVA